MAANQRERDILEAARNALRAEPQLGPDYSPQRLELQQDGALLVEGEVPGVAEKKRCLVRLGAIDGVAAIVDRLRVRPAQEMGDEQIRARLSRFFAQEPSFQSFGVRAMEYETTDPVYRQIFEPVVGTETGTRGRIDIEVRDGVVTLNGHVPTLHDKRLAGVMAWWVPGVRDVIDGLTVEPGEEDGPVRIEEAVRSALEKDPYVDASQVRVGVRGREVRLTGELNSETLRDMAECDAWYVFGVNNVIDEIEVRP